MSKLKNLATCKPSEFLAQTVKIRRAVEKWLTATDIMNIRKSLPEVEKETDEMTAEEKEALKARNRQAIQAQAKKNAYRLFDAIAEEHPAETLEVLALCCFINPAEVDDYPMETYYEAIGDLIGNDAVIGFFTSLARLGATNIL